MSISTNLNSKSRPNKGPKPVKIGLKRKVQTVQNPDFSAKEFYQLLMLMLHWSPCLKLKCSILLLTRSSGANITLNSILHTEQSYHCCTTKFRILWRTKSGEKKLQLLELLSQQITGPAYKRTLTLLKPSSHYQIIRNAQEKYLN